MKNIFLIMAGLVCAARLDAASPMYPTNATPMFHAYLRDDLDADTNDLRNVKGIYLVNGTNLYQLTTNAMATAEGARTNAPANVAVTNTGQRFFGTQTFGTVGEDIVSVSTNLTVGSVSLTAGTSIWFTNASQGGINGIYAQISSTTWTNTVTHFSYVTNGALCSLLNASLQTTWTSTLLITNAMTVGAFGTGTAPGNSLATTLNGGLLVGGVVTFTNLQASGAFSGTASGGFSGRVTNTSYGDGVLFSNTGNSSVINFGVLPDGGTGFYSVLPGATTNQFDLRNGLLRSLGRISIDFYAKIFYDSSGSASLDYANRVLNGSWRFDAVPSVNGNIISTNIPINYTNVAFVEVGGNDANAILGSRDFPYANISAAADALGALGRGVVRIGAGTFTISNYCVPTGITIAGVSKEQTIINMLGPTNSYGFSITNSGVTLQDFALLAPGGYLTNGFYFPVLAQPRLGFPATNVTMRRVRVIGGSDCLYFNILNDHLDIDVLDCDLISSWDVISCVGNGQEGSYSSVRFMNNRITVIGGAPGWTNLARGCVFSRIFTNLVISGNSIRIIGVGDPGIQGISLGLVPAGPFCTDAHVIGNTIDTDDTNVPNLYINNNSTAHVSGIDLRRITNSGKLYWKGGWTYMPGNGLLSTTNNLTQTVTLSSDPGSTVAHNIISVTNAGRFAALTVTGQVSAASLSITGNITAGSLRVTNAITAANASVTNEGDFKAAVITNSLDVGGGNFTVDAAGDTVSAGTISSGGGNFSVNTAGDVVMNTFIADGGSIYSDGSGDLVISGSLSSDGGTITTDGTGNLSVAKLTSAGGVDPPYMLIDVHTFAELKGEVLAEVPAKKRTGAAVGFDGRRLFYYVASEDKFFDLQGNLIASNVVAKPFIKPIPIKTIHSRTNFVKARTNSVIVRTNRVTSPK